MATGPDRQVLQCGIVGAGIAGLSAAIALHRAGHQVQIFERSTFKSEIGAAISFTPNANLVLDRWGFDGRRAGETVKEQCRYLDAQTLECKYHLDFERIAKRFGHPFNAFHRVDAHEELRRLVDGLGGVEVTLGTAVVEIDCAKGVLKLSNGDEVSKDLIVIADGIKSGFVRTITGEDIPARATGRSVYRTLIPISKIMDDPLSRQLYEDQPSGFCNCIDPKTGIFFVTYPCRDDKVMNFAVFHTTKPHQVDAKDWNSPATVEDVLEVLPDFHPAIKAVAQKADTMKCYTVGHREILPCMTNGKAVMIGDAAHPMMPTHAQGGSLSIEDAGALEAFFSDWTADDSVERRLALFNQFRIPRTNVTQLYSNAMFYDTGKGSFLDDERLHKYWKGDFLPPKTPSWSEPIQDFFYGYNVFVEAEKALKYKDDPEGIPDGAIKHFGL